ncbi:MAG TPA: sugar transferase, partial [Thermodesulfobacteriota bacterium]|nr:sugar transferase [Thermodesulfobacteriota bacterium]
MKRIFDIFFSLLGLVFLSPFFALIAILIKTGSSGPVFFRQKRVGRNFSRFIIYKFRTMVVDAEKNGLRITSGGDRRVTKIGTILRKLKIDELPQLFNVLKGDMSLVGPRPEVEEYVMLYEEDYKEILKSRPGITDVSSVVFREEEAVLKNQIDPEGYYKEILLPEKIRLSKEYIQHSTFLFDFKLVLSTLLKI